MESTPPKNTGFNLHEIYEERTDQMANYSQQLLLRELVDAGMPSDNAFTLFLQANPDLTLEAYETDNEVERVHAELIEYVEDFCFNHDVELEENREKSKKELQLAIYDSPLQASEKQRLFKVIEGYSPDTPGLKNSEVDTFRKAQLDITQAAAHALAATRPKKDRHLKLV